MQCDVLFYGEEELVKPSSSRFPKVKTISEAREKYGDALFYHIFCVTPNEMRCLAHIFFPAPLRKKGYVCGQELACLLMMERFFFDASPFYLTLEEYMSWRPL